MEAAAAAAALVLVDGEQGGPGVVSPPPTICLTSLAAADAHMLQSFPCLCDTRSDTSSHAQATRAAPCHEKDYFH